MMRIYRTPKGTDLPLLNLRGKEYLEIKYRLVWFREEHPDWRIETEIVNHTPDLSLVKATIKDNHGNTMSTAHKSEDKKGFHDHLEKSETSAVGRALALVGFGTQFCADELDEGERIVDAPTAPSDDPLGDTPWPEDGAPKATGHVPMNNPGEYEITFGAKYKGKKIKDIPKADLEGFISWLEKTALQKGVALSHDARFLKVNAERYFSSGAKQ